MSKIMEQQPQQMYGEPQYQAPSYSQQPQYSPPSIQSHQVHIAVSPNQKINYEPFTLEQPNLFPSDQLNRNFQTNTDNALLNVTETLRKAVYTVYDFSFLVFNVIFFAVLVPIAFAIGIARSTVSFTVQVCELTIDGLVNPLYEIMYKVMRPPLVLVRIILDTISYIFPLRGRIGRVSIGKDNVV